MNRIIVRKVLWIVGGGVLGFAWYYGVGCTTGSCPISSNPYMSTGYGALVGAVASWNWSKKDTKTNA